MKSIKRIVALVLCLGMITAFVACGDDNGGASGESVTIGIIQYVEHSSLDLAREGFIEALADNGYKEGDSVTFDYQNAQADTSNLSTISQRFVSDKVDMVLAIATPAAQAILGKTETIPILGTAITDYEAANLIDSNNNPGGNMTGTSDMNPVSEQINLLMELCPDVETVGIVYSSNEDNSILQAQMASDACEALGLSVEEGTVTTSNDVQQVTASIASKVDAIYIPTDNVYSTSMPVVQEVCVDAGIPCVTGSVEMVTGGGFATLGISYHDLGYQTGEMAAKILKGEAEIAETPIEFSSEFEYIINGDLAEDLGITIPDKYADYVVHPSQS